MKAKDKKYILQARKQYQKDGGVEIDDNAVVSRSYDRTTGGSNGAYVAAWVWVYKNDLEVTKRVKAKPRRKQSLDCQ